MGVLFTSAGSGFGPQRPGCKYRPTPSQLATCLRCLGGVPGHREKAPGCTAGGMQLERVRGQLSPVLVHLMWEVPSQPSQGPSHCLGLCSASQICLGCTTQAPLPTRTGLLALAQEVSAVPRSAWFAEVTNCTWPWHIMRPEGAAQGDQCWGTEGGGWWPPGGSMAHSLALPQVPMARFLELCPGLGQEPEVERGHALPRLPMVLLLTRWGLWVVPHPDGHSSVMSPAHCPHPGSSLGTHGG